MKYLELLREGRAGTIRETVPRYLRQFHKSYRQLEAVQIGSQPTLLAQQMQLYATRQQTGTQPQQQQPSTPSAEDGMQQTPAALQAAGALLPLSQVSEVESRQAPSPQQRHHAAAAPAAPPRQPQRSATAPAMALRSNMPPRLQPCHCCHPQPPSSSCSSRGQGREVPCAASYARGAGAKVCICLR